MPPARPIRVQRRPKVSSALLFGRCIAAVREDLDLTQAELAERLNLSRAALAQIESGRSAPSFWVLMRLGQRCAQESVDRDATVIFALFHATARELQGHRVRVVNRMLEEGERTIPVAQIDRAVSRVYDREFERYTPPDLAFFEDDDDEGDEE